VTPKIGPTRKTGGESWRARRANAEAFRVAAQRLMNLHEEGENANPILVLIILSAIAYGDALTDRFGGAQNKKDHGALVTLVEKTLGARTDGTQIQRLRRILSEKDEASYGAKIGRVEHARKLLEQLERFGDWASGLLDA